MWWNWNPKNISTLKEKVTLKTTLTYRKVNLILVRTGENPSKSQNNWSQFKKKRFDLKIYVKWILKAMQQIHSNELQLSIVNKTNNTEWGKHNSY